MEVVTATTNLDSSGSIASLPYALFHQVLMLNKRMYWQLHYTEIAVLDKKEYYLLSFVMLLGLANI